jgi:hypothetical protein
LQASGDTTMAFQPVFMGSAIVNGTCPCPEAVGGPSTYQALVILMSDDPTLQAACEEADASVAVNYSNLTNHYLTVQVLALDTTAPIPTGTYSVQPSTVSNPTTGTYADMIEVLPIPPGGADTKLNWLQDDDPTSGTIELDQVGNVVSGSFNAQNLHQFGSTIDGSITGKFTAPVCQAVASQFVQAPCGGCPG